MSDLFVRIAAEKADGEQVDGLLREILDVMFDAGNVFFPLYVGRRIEADHHPFVGGGGGVENVAYRHVFRIVVQDDAQFSAEGKDKIRKIFLKIILIDVKDALFAVREKFFHPIQIPFAPLFDRFLVAVQGSDVDDLLTFSEIQLAYEGDAPCNVVVVHRVAKDNCCRNTRGWGKG